MCKKLYLLFIIISSILILSCKKEAVKDDYEVVIRFKFDSTQQRLDNMGNPSSIPNGNAAQSPKMNSIGAHYVEFTEGALVQLGDGYIPYHAPETGQAGSNALLFNESKVVSEMHPFLTIPLKDFPNGTYEYIRVSLSYQNYDIDLRTNGYDLKGTLASFVAFNTYIESYTIRNKQDNINGNKSQGYWAFEVHDEDLPVDLPIYSGQAPATTVPNPLSETSPIPAGSCVVTGKFDAPLIITDDIDKNIFITLSLSINNSFEWEDPNGNGVFEPDLGENVVDMGLRGLIPLVE